MNNTSIDNSKPVIVVDIDDVLAQYAEAVARFANANWQTNLTVDDIRENWAEMFDITVDEWVRRYRQFAESEPYAQMANFADASSVLTKLKKSFDLVVVTSRINQLRPVTLEWIENNFPNTFSEIIFAGLYDDYSAASTTNLHALARRTKVDILSEVGAAYLIDDQPKHANAAAESGIQALLFGDYGWNRDAAIVDGVTRVADWGEVAEYFGA